MRYSKDFLNEKYKQLPEVVKNAMGSVDRGNLIKSIAEKHQMHIDQAGLLLEEIMYVTLGIEKTSDFIRNLKVHLRIPENKVNVIAGDVNEKIFLPVREALKNVANKSAQDIKSEAIEIIDDNNLHKKEVKIENKIDHAPLTESQEIKQHIARQQAVKPVVAPPPNLPTGETNGEAMPLNLEKKPTHTDPYREPID